MKIKNTALCVCALVFSLLVIATIPAYAHEEEFIGVFPAHAYYDAKYEKAILLPFPPEPIGYPAFSMEIETNPDCGWIPITGRVPYYGLVSVEVRLGNELITTQNINSHPEFELRGWINIACDLPSNEYLVNLMWQELPRLEQIHGTEIWNNYKIFKTFEIAINNLWN